jgi:8-oxo-dGTP diphosphatase
MDANSIEGCGALIYSRNTHRYLFLLRTQKKFKGSWGLVGGGVESGESVRNALVRETQEEIGFDISGAKLIPLEKFTSDDEHFSYHTFLVPVDNEFVPVLNHEHKGYCWVHLDDYPRPLHPGVWRTFKFNSVVKKIRTMEEVL